MRFVQNDESDSMFVSCRDHPGDSQSVAVGIQEMKTLAYPVGS